MSHATVMSTAYISDPNGVPKDGDGCVTHLGLKQGQLAARVVSVESLSRAQCLRGLLDTVTFEHASPRGFTTFTGTVGGVEISVVATGMGLPMMDFLVRTCHGTSSSAAPAPAPAQHLHRQLRRSQLLLKHPDLGLQ